MKQIKTLISESLEEGNSVLFGQLSRYIEERVHAEVKPVHETVGRIEQTLDGLVAQITTDEQERVALSGQLDRHAGWIGQLAKATNVNLVPEQ